MKFIRFCLLVLTCSLLLSACSAARHEEKQPTPTPHKICCNPILPTSTSQPATPPTATPKPQLPVVNLPSDRQFLGVYDRWEHRFDSVPMDVEHDFISWEKADEMATFISGARSRNRVPMITVEAWVTASGVVSDVVSDTNAGKNDDIIRADARAIKAAAPQTVLVRFAHEMELVGLYPWSTAEPAAHIAMFRHYVDLFRQEGVTNVRWIWAPAGNANAAPYYPGDAYVDMVSVTVLGYEAWDLQFGAKQAHSFDELFADKYKVVATFGKPVIIGELGVCASANARTPEEQEEYKAHWLKEAAGVLTKYPLLRGIVYFDSFNASNGWTGDVPDWRIQPSSLWPREAMPPVS